jgi:hypothetical protein
MIMARVVSVQLYVIEQAELADNGKSFGKTLDSFAKSA